jgi:predicted secreted protein
MKKDTHITKVQFRILRDEVFAVFPYDVNKDTNVTCYSHIGQHSTCDVFINTFSKPATKEQYKDLFNELKNIGYNLQVIKRRSHLQYLKEFHKLFKEINLPL